MCCTLLLEALQSGAVCRSLLERILGARLVYQQTNMARALSFEYLNRQLIWHELSELLLFLLPLLNLPRLRRLLLPYLPRLPSLSSHQPAAGNHLLASSATDHLALGLSRCVIQRHTHVWSMLSCLHTTTAKEVHCDGQELAAPGSGLSITTVALLLNVVQLVDPRPVQFRDLAAASCHLDILHFSTA